MGPAPLDCESSARTAEAENEGIYYKTAENLRSYRSSVADSLCESLGPFFPCPKPFPELALLRGAGYHSRMVAVVALTLFILGSISIALGYECECGLPGWLLLYVGMVAVETSAPLLLTWL